MNKKYIKLAKIAQKCRINGIKCRIYALCDAKMQNEMKCGSYTVD